VSRLTTTKSLAYVVASTVCICSAQSALAVEVSVTQPIAQLLYDASADYLYMVGSAKWGAPSCPNATYAQVTGNVPGRKQLLAIALAAKASGAQVYFQGTCSHPNYFDITYIVVQPQ
jgi:hypothetical protein